MQGIAELRDLAASVEAKPAQPAAPDAAATERAERILEQLKLHLATRGTQATLELHPEHLGHIAIKLSMHKGKLRAELSADNVDTLAALQRHAPELRTMLEVRGVQPESFDFRLDLERHDRRPAEQDSSRSRSSRERAQGVAAVAARSSTELRRALADAWGVDTYA